MPKNCEVGLLVDYVFCANDKNAEDFLPITNKICAARVKTISITEPVLYIYKLYTSIHVDTAYGVILQTCKSTTYECVKYRLYQNNVSSDGSV